MAEKVKGIRLRPTDNVVTLMKKADQGALIYWDGQTTAPISALDNIPAFHKIAIEEIALHDIILKYGHPIGVATKAIAAGMHVHTQNCVGMEKRSK